MTVKEKDVEIRDVLHYQGDGTTLEEFRKVLKKLMIKHKVVNIQASICPKGL